jgi:hypothetical protein
MCRPLSNHAIHSLRSGVSEDPLRISTRRSSRGGFDLVQQRAIDRGHHQAGSLRAPIAAGSEAKARDRSSCLRARSIWKRISRSKRSDPRCRIDVFGGHAEARSSSSGR